MASLMYGILTKLLNGRNAMDLKCSEAKKLVAEFYLEVEAATLPIHDKRKIDSLANAILRKYGLEYFAS